MSDQFSKFHNTPRTFHKKVTFGSNPLKVYILCRKLTDGSQSRLVAHVHAHCWTKQYQTSTIFRFLFIYLFILLLFTFKRSLSGTLHCDFQKYFDKAIVGAT